MLRASLLCDGRSLPLLSWIVPSEKQQNSQIQKNFLDALAEAVNPVARVIIVTDAGFQSGFAPIFPDICYHLTHYRPAAADIPVASDNPAHYADAIRYNARTPLQGSLLPLTRLVWA